MNKNKWPCVFVFCSVLSVAQQVPTNPEISIRLASYNVENLFDARHDEDPTLPHGKEDFTFLELSNPLKSLCPEVSSSGFYLKQCLETDWTTDHAAWKLENAAKALSYLSKKPDVITLAEVENERVVKALARLLGYSSGYLVSNSPDHRGIDVAVLYNKSKLRLVESREIPVVGPDLYKPTRNLLRAKFQLKKSPSQVLADQYFYVYANHWPSQAAPAKTRMLASRILKEDIENVRASVRGQLFFAAMGDFNTIPSDNPHPFNDLLTNSNEWEGALVDTEEYAREQVPSLNQTLLPGSYYFSRDRTWNKLDRIFISQNLVDDRGAEVNPRSFFILKDERLMVREELTSGPNAGQIQWIPRRFNPMATSQREMGFSDHLPIGVELRFPSR